MNIIQVFNEYRTPYGGEWNVIHDTVDLLKIHGHNVILETKSSDDIKTFMEKSTVFFSSIYSLNAKKDFSSLLHRENPDIVHIHNLYPLFTPSILNACRQHNIPVVQTLHNQLLTCPISLNSRKNKICEKCLDGKEYWCVIHNCAQNGLKSINYALRFAYARKKQLFRNNVTIHICLTNFQKNRLAQHGYPEKSLSVLPQMISIPDLNMAAGENNYVLFVGRFDHIKGIATLIESARLTPEIPYLVVGDGPLEKWARGNAPDSVTFTGFVPRNEIGRLYKKARVVVFPSTNFEGFPLVPLEAMSYGVPVVASRIGGLPEIVEDGKTGLLFEPGNGSDLSRKVASLWNNEGLCSEMGAAGRGKAEHSYTKEHYYIRLMDIYYRAIHMIRNNN